MTSENNISVGRMAIQAMPPLMFVMGLVLVSVESTGSPVPKLIGFALLIAVVIWGCLKCRSSDDEVVRAANVVAMAVGAPISLGVAFLSIFVVRFTPAVGTLVYGFAERASTDVGPAVAGFGLGMMFVCALVTAGACMAWIGWWIAKR